MWNSLSGDTKLPASRGGDIELGNQIFSRRLKPAFATYNHKIMFQSQVWAVSRKNFGGEFEKALYKPNLMFSKTQFFTAKSCVSLVEECNIKVLHRCHIARHHVTHASSEIAALSPVAMATAGAGHHVVWYVALRCLGGCSLGTLPGPEFGSPQAEAHAWPLCSFTTAPT